MATVLLAGGCLVSFAQTKVPSDAAADAQIPAQTGNPAPAANPDSPPIPAANPGRPTVTNPASLPPVGYLQFEQGFVQANDSPSGPDSQFSLVQTTKLSLHSRLMLQFQSQPIALSHFSATPGSAASSQTDPGDLVIGVQGVLMNEASHKPAIAVSYLRRVRSGTSPDLDVGSFSQSAILLVSGDFGPYHFDSNYIVSEQSDDIVRRAQFGQTLSVNHNIFAKALNAKLGLSGELWHFTQPLVDTTRAGSPSPRSNAVGTLWALSYLFRPNLVLDCGVERGLTSTSTAWQGFAGFTYLLPHRLWGQSK